MRRQRPQSLELRSFRKQLSCLFPQLLNEESWFYLKSAQRCEVTPIRKKMLSKTYSAAAEKQIMQGLWSCAFTRKGWCSQSYWHRQSKTTTRKENSPSSAGPLLSTLSAPSTPFYSLLLLWVIIGASSDTCCHVYEIEIPINQVTLLQSVRKINWESNWMGELL